MASFLDNKWLRAAAGIGGALSDSGFLANTSWAAPVSKALNTYNVVSGARNAFKSDSSVANRIAGLGQLATGAYKLTDGGRLLGFNGGKNAPNRTVDDQEDEDLSQNNFNTGRNAVTGPGSLSPVPTPTAQGEDLMPPTLGAPADGQQGLLPPPVFTTDQLNKQMPATAPSAAMTNTPAAASAPAATPSAETSPRLGLMEQIRNMYKADPLGTITKGVNVASSAAMLFEPSEQEMAQEAYKASLAQNTAQLDEQYNQARELLRARLTARGTIDSDIYENAEAQLWREYQTARLQVPITAQSAYSNAARTDAYLRNLDESADVKRFGNLGKVLQQYAGQ